jgi:hypothetical protein
VVLEAARLVVRLAAVRLRAAEWCIRRREHRRSARSQ